MMQIIPAILAKSFDEFQEQALFASEYFELAQIDVMDGKFVKNKTFYNLDEIKQIDIELDYELHLMVEDPESIIEEWVSFEKVKRFIIHYETFHKRKKDLYDIMDYIRKNRKEIGIAINPDTKISKILEFLPKIDQLLVMGVNPGWSGQKFNTSVLEKISAVREYYPELDIAVDGGVSEGTYQQILEAGANILDSNSMIYQYKDNPEELRKLIKNIIG